MNEKLNQIIRYCENKENELRKARNNKLADKWLTMRDMAARNKGLQNGMEYFAEFVDSQMKPGNHLPGTDSYNISAEIKEML